MSKPVPLFVEGTGFESDHRPDRGLTGNVGVVEGFDPFGEAFEVAELPECFGHGVPAGCTGVFEQLPGVGPGEVGQPFFRPALRYRQGGFFTEERREVFGDQGSGFEVVGEENGGDHRRDVVPVELQQCPFVGLVGVEPLVEGDKVVGAGDDFPLPHEHPDDCGPAAVVGNGEDVEILPGRQVDLAELFALFDPFDPIPERRRLFEAHHLRIESHLLFQGAQQRFLVLDVSGGRLDDGPVGFGGDLHLAGGETLLQLVVEAGFARFEAPLLLHQRAELVNGVENVPGSDGVGAEVADVFSFDDFAGDLEPGVGPVEVDVDVGVGFVVAQQDVVFGFELLDQGVFQDQRVVFAFDDDIVQRDRFAEHLPDAGGEGRVGCEYGGEAEIAFDPLFQAFGLADIEQMAAGVEVVVDAGAVRQVLNLFEHGRVL